MTGEAELLSSKFFWKNIYFSGLFREKHILFVPMIQGKTVFFLKNQGKICLKMCINPVIDCSISVDVLSVSVIFVFDML